jgi:hypothetical protein
MAATQKKVRIKKRAACRMFLLVTTITAERIATPAKI